MKYSAFLHRICYGPDSGVNTGISNGGSPLVAAQWANPNFEIPGFRVLGPNEAPMPGDIAAVIRPGDGFTGHVAIVTNNGMTTGTWTGEIIMENNNFIKRDGENMVYRRWEGND